MGVEVAVEETDERPDRKVGGKRKSERGLDLKKEVRDLECALVVPSESVLEELS
jgi:hypothetical protein